MSLTLTPSSLALEQTLSCLHKCSKEVELKQVHAHMLKSGFFHDPYAITKFLSFCLSSTFSSYAQDVFLNGLDRPDTFLWNLMIKGLSSSDQPESSLLLYHRMLSSSAPHNPYTFPFLLKACSNLSAFQETTQIHAHLTKLGYANDVYSVNSLINSYAVTGRFNHARLLFDRIQEPDLVSWNSVIKGYAKAGEMDTALTLFRTIPQEKKNAISWTTIISGYVQAGMNKEALQLFHEMQNSNVPPDKVSLASALSACAQLGALEQGRWIHSYADKARISIDSVLACALIDMYAKCGDMEEALGVFKDVKKKTKSVQVWTALISGYSYHGLGGEAIRRFTEMQKTGVKPNAITLTAVLTACSYTGLVEEGKSVFYTMERDYNVKPTIEHYGCMVDLLGRAGLLDEANRLVQKIPMKANAVIWGSLLKACQIHKNIELGERIGEILIGMDPNHGGRYVHTANIHATGGKWDKAAETRRLMKEKGVVKVPGCSTISLEGTTHEFVAGDGSHAEIEIIRSKWRTVRRRLEENGYVPELEDLLLDLADDEEREAIVHQHSEKLAVAYGLMKTKPGTTIRVMKNLRVCKDCHKVMKLVSEIYKRDIVMRDRTRFHRFRDGKCTCGDYW
ncbi:pentatricopeptide repeat-containing protein At5g66520-like [Brassica napus]|uniref:pentatricopeptide repeat-containing protein At5g66520-like n=1 Tax=Brassica napus TaxID=3708 RepID=UPI0006AB567B|nr:pentatricopeptide repeat-containing protein At5g66520-like [Brassica napus]